MRRFLASCWRLLRAEIVLGFLIGTVCWIGVLGWQAAYAPTDAEKQKCHQTAEKEHHKTEECKTLWERTTSDPVAFFTLWLVVFTGGLTISTILLWQAGEESARHARRAAAIQSRDMQRSIAVAEKAADAALLSAKAAIGLELPFLRLEPSKFGSGTTRTKSSSTLHYFSVAAISMSNTGRTKAIPIEIDCGWTFGDSLPPNPTYPWGCPFKVDAVIESAPAEPIEFWLHELQMEVPVDAYEQLRTRNAEFWFYARLTYLDFMGTKHEACFCWRRIENFGAGSFAIDDTPSYNRKT